MADDTELSTVLRELREYGLKPTHQTTNGNHIAITWCVPGKEPRTYVVANTGSDWRGRLNARAAVRRYLKADNARKPETAPKPQSTLQRALSVPAATPPTPPLSVPEQYTAVRSELADLTDLMLAMLQAVEDFKAMREQPSPQLDAMIVQHHTPVPRAINGENGLAPHAVLVEPPRERRQRRKMDRTPIDRYLSRSWTDFHTLVKQSGVPKQKVQQKLYYLERTNRVERNGDQYRLVKHTRPPMIVIHRGDRR